MLPGETRDVWLFDEPLKQCVATAAATHSYVGGLLMNEEQGSPYELAMVLRIADIKDGADDGTMWVQLVCTSRCKIGTVRRNKQYGYRVAVVMPYSDSVDTSVTTSLDELRALHSTVASLRRQLHRRLLDAASFDSGTWEALSRQPSFEKAPRERDERIFVGPDHQVQVPFGVYESFESFEETGVLVASEGLNLAP